MESGIHSSLHSNCHHQIVFAKFNLSIFYPPPYERTVWYCERANTELIRRAIDQFDWLRALSNINIDEKAYFFTKMLLSKSKVLFHVKQLFVMIAIRLG